MRDIGRPMKSLDLVLFMSNYESHFNAMKEEEAVLYLHYLKISHYI